MSGRDAGEEHAELRARITAWLVDDPDPVSRRRIREMELQEKWDELEECFAGPLEFGTAGLRGILGVGPSRMNEANVVRATYGLARQVLADVPDAAERGVVIGRDARRGSEELARVAARVLAGQGVRAHFFVDPVPTPLAAFAGRHLNAAATVVVTASHNPPKYNGYKVFSERGSQIVPPQDGRIREEMDAAPCLRDLPRPEIEEAREDGLFLPLLDDMGERYLEALDAQCFGSGKPPAPMRAVLTPLHGVGHKWVTKALQRRGFEELHPVLEQIEPDGAFPTVAFPNPEEEGALDLAKALAAEVDADLIVANDPDTDRLCVAVPGGDNGGFVQLTGNQVGVLLGDWLFGERKRQKSLPDGAFSVTTVVSTSMLEEVADAYGAGCYETLTGFKWLWDRALAAEEAGGTFVFAFEEALGYCVGPVVRDKDGIGAAQAIMECAAALKAEGKTLSDRLDELSREHGVYATAQRSVVLPGSEGKARIAAIMAELRAEPPAAIAGSKVKRSRDLIEGAGDLPPGNVLTWWLADGSRVTFRPSGTEPKLKSYLEVRQKVPKRGKVAVARRKAGERLAELIAWVNETVQE